VLSYIYELPVKTSSKAVNAWPETGPWRVTSFDNGLPFFPLLTTDNENIGTVGGRNTEFRRGGESQCYLAADAPALAQYGRFAVPRPFTVGNAGRFIVRPTNLRIGTSVFKGGLSRKRSVELRGEFFNLFNNVNFGYPGGLLNTPQFGVCRAHAQSG